MHFILNKKRWEYRREYLPDDRHGDCDASDSSKKAIRIDKRVTGKHELEIILHELRHAENHDLYDEDYVLRVSKDNANLLWRLKYRKLTDEQLAILGIK